MREVKFSKVRQVVKGHTTSKWQIQDPNAGLWGSTAHVPVPRCLLNVLSVANAKSFDCAIIKSADWAMLQLQEAAFWISKEAADGKNFWKNGE